MIQIFIVDDQLIIREGVKRLLDRADNIRILGEARDGESALQQIGDLKPDIVLLDINLPDLDGLDVAQKINHKFPQIQIIILSGNEQESYVKRAVSMGAKGYLAKNLSSEELQQTIELVYQGYSVIKPEPSQQRPLTVSHSQSHHTVASDRSLDSQASAPAQTSQDPLVQLSQDYYLPKPEQIKTNLDGIENLLAKNHIQQRYAKYNRRGGKGKRFYNANLSRLKKTLTSFEFGLLTLIVLFSLSFLTMVALSR